MKKFVCAFLFLAAFAVVFSGPAAAADKTLGVAWAGKAGMAKRVLEGFKKGMAEKGPQIKLEIVPELADMAALAATVKKFQASKSAMVILRSNGAKWLGKNPPSIPAFIGGCNHPVLLGAVKSLEAPGGNITGVTYFLPKESQFEIFKAVVPNLRSILLLVDKSNPSAAIDIQDTEKVCKQMGIKLTIKNIKDTAEAVSAAGAAAGKVSAIVLGVQAKVFDAAKAIVAAAGKTPVLAYTEKPVQDGALGGFGADDRKLGYMLAQSVVDVLVNGKAVGSLPIKMDPAPKFFINAATIKKLGLEVPYEILESATILGK